MSDTDRTFLADALAALCVLVQIDPATLPQDHDELRKVLVRAAVDERLSWERAASVDRDHDRATRCRRWERAVEAAWELVAHELDVASGRRRAGWAA